MMQENHTRPIDETAADFVRDLAEICRKHKLGISGTITPYIMENDDFDRTFVDDGDGNFEFI